MIKLNISFIDQKFYAISHVTTAPLKKCSPKLRTNTLKAFNNFKNKRKSVLSNVFDMLKYVYSENVFNTLYIEIKHKC